MISPPSSRGHPLFSFQPFNRSTIFIFANHFGATIATCPSIARFSSHGR